MLIVNSNVGHREDHASDQVWLLACHANLHGTTHRVADCKVRYIRPAKLLIDLFRESYGVVDLYLLELYDSTPPLAIAETPTVETHEVIASLRDLCAHPCIPSRIISMSVDVLNDTFAVGRICAWEAIVLQFNSLICDLLFAFEGRQVKVYRVDLRVAYLCEIDMLSIKYSLFFSLSLR